MEGGIMIQDNKEGQTHYEFPVTMTDIELNCLEEIVNQYIEQEEKDKELWEFEGGVGEHAYDYLLILQKMVNRIKGIVSQ